MLKKRKVLIFGNIFLKLKNLIINKRFWFLIVVVLGVYYFYRPILTPLNALGIQDWDQNFAWNEFTRLSILKYHQFPFWDPFRCGGAVHFANPEMGVFSIQTLFVLILGTVAGIKISILFHGLLGFLGFYLLAKQYKLSSRASFVSSLVFSFSGIVGSYLSTGMVAFISFAYSPYILYFFNKGEQDKKWLLIASGLFAASIYFGYHTPLILLILIIVSCIANWIVNNNLKPIINLLVFTVLSVVLALPKLILSLQLISVFPRNLTDISGFYFKDLLYFLLSRKQSLIGNMEVTGYTFRIDETSLYVGIVPLLLFLAFFIKNTKEIKKHLPLLISLLVIILLMLGNTIVPSLYDFLRNLPFYSSFRVAQRFRFDFIILFSLIVGLGFDRLSQLVHNNKHKTLLFFCIAAIIYLDLVTLSSNNFLKQTLIINNNLAPTAPREFSQVSRYEDYSKLSYRNGVIPKSLEGTLYFRPWSLEYLTIRQNIGTLICYDAITDITSALGKDSNKYIGEWYLKNKSRTVSLKYWSPNVMSFEIQGEADKQANDTFVVNQNYYPGWYVEIDSKIQKAESYFGLLSVTVTSKTKTLNFKFLPYKSLLK